MTNDSNNTSAQELPLSAQLRVLFAASKGFWLVNFVNFADGIAYFGILTLLTRFLGQDLGMGDQTTGMTVSAYTGLVTLFMFGGGFVSDRLGVRRALTWSLGVIGLGRVLLTTSPAFAAAGPGAAWIGLLLMALGTGVLQPALYAGVKEYADPRTASIGYSLLYAIMNLGIVAENFVSPYIRESALFLSVGGVDIVGLGWGINGVFWTCTILTGLMLLVHLTFFTRRVEERECLYRTEASPSDANKSWSERLADLPFLDPRFMFFIFILLPVRTLFAHQFLTMPDYVFRCFPAEVGAKFEWLNGLNPLIIVIFVPLITVMTRRVRVIDMMIAGTTLTAITTFLLVPGPNLSALIWYITLFSLGEAVWSSRFLEHVAEIAPAGKVGAYMGLAGIPWFLAKFTTGFYSGAMLNRFIPEGGPHNSGTLWLIYGIIACVSPIALIATRGWLVPKK